MVDLETAVDVLGGKIEFETGEEGREREILDHLLRTATAETVRGHFRGLDFALLVEAIEDGAHGHHRRAGHRARLPGRAAGAGGVRALRRGLRPARRHRRRRAASAIELALEGLYLARKIGKDTGGRRDRLWLSDRSPCRRYRPLRRRTRPARARRSTSPRRSTRSART